MAFLKTMFGFLDCNVNAEIWNRKFKKLPSKLANRNSEHDKLRDFDEKLKTSYNELAEEKDKINLNEFVYSLLKDGGVKTKIIKKYLPPHQPAGESLSADDGVLYQLHSGRRV